MANIRTPWELCGVHSDLSHRRKKVYQLCLHLGSLWAGEPRWALWAYVWKITFRLGSEIPLVAVLCSDHWRNEEIPLRGPSEAVQVLCHERAVDDRLGHERWQHGCKLLCANGCQAQDKHRIQSCLCGTLGNALYGVVPLHWDHTHWYCPLVTSRFYAQPLPEMVHMPSIVPTGDRTFLSMVAQALERVQGWPWPSAMMTLINNHASQHYNYYYERY